MDIEEAFAIMHPALSIKRMQRLHDERQRELLEIIDSLQARAAALSTELARLERVYSSGL